LKEPVNLPELPWLVSPIFAHTMRQEKVRGRKEERKTAASEIYVLRAASKTYRVTGLKLCLFGHTSVVSNCKIGELTGNGEIGQWR
jgi:hypothetical protein